VNFAGVQSITIPEGDVKSIAIGGVTAWTKPNPLPYDAEVEYLESTGSQYIDTGFVGGSSSAVEIVASSPNTANNAALFGARDSGTNYGFAIWQRAVIGSNAGVRFDYFAVSSDERRIRLASNAWDASGRNIVRKDGPDNFLNGVQSNGNPAATFVCNYSFFLGAINTAGTASLPFVGKVYSCDIFSGSTLVRDLHPVRVGTVGYLYDRANPTGGPLGNGLYGSATSTPLGAGPDKNGG
jgi:hypothetical protein